MLCVCIVVCVCVVCVCVLCVCACVCVCVNWATCLMIYHMPHTLCTMHCNTNYAGILNASLHTCSIFISHFLTLSNVGCLVTSYTSMTPWGKTQLSLLSIPRGFTHMSSLVVRWRDTLKSFLSSSIPSKKTILLLWHYIISTKHSNSHWRKVYKVVLL